MSTTAGIGGNNSVFVVLEDTYGTYIDPADGAADGLWTPILSETLMYNETKYYSKQIREQTIDSDVKQSYYHIAGDIVMEVDAKYLPFFLYASRHTIGKTGSGPYVYSATPSNMGSAYPGGAAKGLSITIDRNGNGFGYAGCVITQWAFTVQDGVLRVTMSILGLSEQEPADLDTTSWAAPNLFGAAAHAVYVDASGTAPAFTTPATNFNGFTATLNYNGTPENRIVRDRAATFVAYGETEATYETELDFLTRAEYDDYVAATTRSMKFESINGGVDWAGATSGCRIIYNRSAYDAYEVDTPDIGSLVMARTTGHGLAQTGGVPFKIECKSPTNIT